VICFNGYRRKGRPPGIRNLVLVISGDLSCNAWSREIAAPFTGCHAILHKHGVGNFAPDRLLFKRLLAGLTIHPNVAGFIFVSSGNEDHAPREILADARRLGVPFRVVALGAVRSADVLVQAGRRAAQRLLAQARAARRTPCDIAQLRLGLNCAGTDLAGAQSGHLVCGLAVDALTAAGATVLLSETPDLLGVESELRARCVRVADRAKLAALFASHRKRLCATAEDPAALEMVRFNRRGGLKTLRAKGRISLLKAGSAAVREVIAYGTRPARAGLVFMDGPALSDFVLAGMLGAGAQLTLNVCGAGPANALPFVVGADFAPPVMPVLKITAGAKYFRHASNRIDFNAAPVAAGADHAPKCARNLLARIVAVASGAATRSEDTKDYLLPIPVEYQQA
jgi:altronate dehydratase large subunit